MIRKEEIQQEAIKQYPRFAERRIGFIAGADWAIAKFEENRLKACDTQTKEETAMTAFTSYSHSPYVADKAQESYENYGQGIDHDLYMRIFLDGVKTGYAQLSMEIDKELEKRKKK